MCGREVKLQTLYDATSKSCMKDLVLPIILNKGVSGDGICIRD